MLLTDVGPLGHELIVEPGGHLSAPPAHGENQTKKLLDHPLCHVYGSAMRAPPLSASFQRWARRRLLGFDVAVVRHSQSNNLGPHLMKVLPALDVDVVIDVGANRGQTVSEFRAFGYQGKIVSFEPTPQVFRELIASCGHDKRWAGHCLALGSQAGEQTLHRFQNESFNSFHLPSSLGSSYFSSFRAPLRGEISVPVRRLDDVWEDLIPAGNVFLKVDTQGFDLEVISGAERKIGGIRGIMTEVAINRIYEGVPTMLEALSFMEERGFQLSGLFPIRRDSRRVRLIEANCVFIRPSILGADTL